ncbi:MAG: glycosyltransferase family 4 protein [bacterium]
MKIKVLYIMEGSSFGGGSRAFLQLVKGMNKELFDPSFACLSGGQLHQHLTRAGIRHYPLDFIRLISPKIFWDLWKIFKKEQPHIVHNQGTRVEFYSRITARLTKIPVIFSTAAMYIDDFDIGCIKKAVYSCMDWISRKYAHHFIVVSEAGKQKLINMYHIRPEKISVIYNGIEPEIYNPERYDAAALKHKLGIPPDALVIGSAGRLCYQKAFHVFIESAAQVLASYPNIQFLLVGDGPLKKDLEQLAHKSGIDKNIIFTGFRNDIPEMLACMDIFVLSSILEGNPIILLEAMAMAKPMVVTEIDGVKEVVENHKSAYVVNPGNPQAMADCIKDLIKDKHKAKNMGLRSQQEAKAKYDIKQAIKFHEKLYRDSIHK